MQIGFVQMTPEWGDIETNLSTIGRLVRTARADLLVLPEFFATGYLFLNREEILSLAEPIPDGRTTAFLSALSRETGTILVGGLPERHGDDLFNSAVMTAPDGHIFTYRKTHLFFREKLFFLPGDTGFNVFEIQGIRIGMMICFDWIFPEASRTLALKGADIIVHPSNLVLPYCPRAMVTRCLENHVFAITCNRAGQESREDQQLKYIGNSRIISPRGDVLAGADDEREIVQVVTVDPRESRDKQLNPHNHLLQDRREVLYS